MASKPGSTTLETPMHLAEILSDLTSLRVCDSTAALALVFARPSKARTNASHPTTDEQTQDADIQRAKDLVELHYSVREARKRGDLTQGLEEARRRVWELVKT